MPGRLAIAPAAITALLAFSLTAAGPDTVETGSSTPVSGALPLAAKPPAKPKRKLPPIVVQSSIRGVWLGMDAKRVREVMRKRPDKSRTDSHPIVQRTRTWRFGRLRVVFDGVKSSSRVISVSTTGRKDRTTRGVGVGSKEATVRRRVRGAKCRTEYGYRSCSVGKATAGQAMTDFAISRRGRVSRVTLARVLD